MFSIAKLHKSYLRIRLPKVSLGRLCQVSYFSSQLVHFMKTKNNREKLTSNSYDFTVVLFYGTQEGSIQDGCKRTPQYGKYNVVGEDQNTTNGYQPKGIVVAEM